MVKRSAIVMLIANVGARLSERRRTVHVKAHRMIWLRLVGCALGVLLLVGAMVVLATAPSTLSTFSGVGTSSVHSVKSTDSAGIIWATILAATGIAAFVGSFVLASKLERR